MDFDFRLDLSEVTRAVESTDVVAIYFPLLRKTLLIDARSSDVDPPMIKVMPMVSTPEDRFKSLRRLRPRFPRPESITIIPWPKYVASLARLGVWEHIISRFVNLGFRDAVRQCEASYQELLAMEAEEIRHAVAGENYQPLWEKAGKPGESDQESDEEEA